MALTIGKLLSDPGVWIFVVVALGMLLYFSRHYIGAILTSLFFDYVVDGVFSGLDELIGIGETGLDVGDWIGALLIFIRYRKQVHPIWAAVFAWEATGFLPISLIPVVGTGAEWIFNFFPIITIVIFVYQHKANEIYMPICAYDQYLKDHDKEMEKEMKGSVDKVHELYDACDYHQLAILGKGIKVALYTEVKQVILKKLNKAQDTIIGVLEKALARGGQSVSSQQVMDLKGNIKVTGQNIDRDWHMASQQADQILQRVSSLAYGVQHPKYSQGIFHLAAERQEKKQQPQGAAREGIMEKVFPQETEQQNQTPQNNVVSFGADREKRRSQQQPQSSGIEQRFQEAEKKAGVQRNSAAPVKKPAAKPAAKKPVAKKPVTKKPAAKKAA
jgi:hypothetical protein